MRAKRPSWSEPPPPPPSMGTEHGREQPWPRSLMLLPRRPPARALRPPPPARPPPPPRGLRRRLLGASPPPRRSRRLPAALGGGRAEGPSRIILRGREVLLSLRGAPSPTSPLSLPISAFNTTIMISDSRGGGGLAGGRGAPSVLAGRVAGEGREDQEGEGRVEKNARLKAEWKLTPAPKWLGVRPPPPPPPAGSRAPLIP